MTRYKPVKLAYKLLEPKCGSDDHLSPLIILHGLGFTSEVTWDDLPQKFADQTKRKVYTLDARNHGDSEWNDEFDFDLNVDDFFNFIDEKGFSKVIVIGHSMGGTTGIKAALRAPERIEMLIVEEQHVKKPSASLMKSSRKFMCFWREIEKFIFPEIDKKDADKLITEYILSKLDPTGRLFYNRAYWDDLSYPLGKDSSGRYFFKVNLEILLEKMKNAESIVTENEGSYDGPSCFLYGINSPTRIGEKKNDILKHFPRAVFVPFDSNSHLVHKMFSDSFAKIVVNFIKQNESSQ